MIIRILVLPAKGHCQIYMTKTEWMTVKINDNQNKILWVSDRFY